MDRAKGSTNMALSLPLNRETCYFFASEVRQLPMHGLILDPNSPLTSFDIAATCF